MLQLSHVTRFMSANFPDRGDVYQVHDETTHEKQAHAAAQEHYDKA